VSVDALETIGVLSERRYEEDDTMVSLDGSWTSVSDSKMSGGAYVYANSAGSAANIAFTGTRIDWITSIGPANGKARLTLDDGAPIEVDLYSPDFKFKQTVWSSGTLSAGTHTLRIEWTGTKNASASGTNIGLDALDVIGVLAPRRYEQSASEIAYVDAWSTAFDSRMSAGSYEYADSATSTAIIEFVGSSFDWLTAVGTGNGIAALTIDSQPTVYVDLYSPTFKYMEPVWSSGTLSHGSHRVTIEWTGTKNPSSSGNNIGIDAVDIVGVLATASP
jgi:hypothetical protein